MPAFPPSHRTILLCLVVLFAACLGAPARAQVLGGDRGTTALVTPDNPLAQLRQRLSGSANVPLPLEGAVDPAAYVVGPGDLFDVSVGGARPVLVTLPVTADGRLVLPDAGSIAVAGLTLGDARARAVEALQRQFQRVQVDVALAQPRQFYVHVSGAVPLPGRHLATPVARVASVIEQAFADSTQPAVTNRTYRPSLRNITLIHRDGTQRSLDLLRYFATGDVDQNPYLRDGDIVSVPSYEPSNASVFVDGAVAFPGAYAFRPGDTLRDLLVLATGSEAPPGGRAVRLTRQQSGGTTTETYDVAAAGAAVALQPLDHLFVLPPETVRGTARVSGQVRYPGTYPVVPGTTTLRELVEMAGGLRPDALARGAYLERNTLPEPGPARLSRADRTDLDLLRPTALRPDTAAILQGMRLAGFDYLSRAYFAQELRLQNRVSLDLGAVLDAQGETVVVQDGDHLVVPRDQQTVYVFGQVGRPGYVNYVPGRDAAYYVAAAGGAGLLATDAYVIEAGTGRYLPAATAPIQSGDMIFLDRERAVADSPAAQQLLLTERQMRTQARIQTAQIAIQVIGTVATIVTTYLFLNADGN